MGCLDLSWPRLWFLCLELQGRAEPELIVASDSDYAGGEQMRSSSGWAVWLRMCGHTVLLDATAKKQGMVSLSVGESELYAAVSAAADAIHYRAVLSFLGIGVSIWHYTDSASTLGVLAKLGGSRRTRHIDARVLWVQGLQNRPWYHSCKVPSQDNPADILTKPMVAPESHRAAFGLRSAEGQETS